ncbi:MAG: type II secretion system GspH family protein [Planctomycetes bacterium]|nr:type II secretion system GspH family protein [Planctomycetota bacterium]
MPRRHAFTLLELLVVLGIMLLVAALSMGAFFRTQTTSKLVATERLVAGMIRQAVHQARTSGFPVTLVFSADERTVTGINQSQLITAGFDGALAEQSDTNWLVPGQTGDALTIIGNLDPAAGGTALAPLAPLLEKRLRLASRNTSRCDGFAIQIAVNLPDFANPVYRALNPPCLPLTLLSTDLNGSANAGLSTSDDAPAGLFLWRRDVSLFDSAADTPLKLDGSPFSNTVPVWELIGWVRHDSGTVYVSSLDHSLSAATDTGLARLRRLGLPCGGWHDLALAWDGARLELLCDGIAIASQVAAGRRLSTGTGPASTLAVWLGGMHVTGDLANHLKTALDYPPSNPPPAPPLKPEMVLPADPGFPLIDNLRIAALGEGQAGQLPRGIGPATNLVVSVTPQGRVLVNGATGQVLSFVGDFEQADSRVEITLNNDGTLKTELIPGSR